MGYKLYPYVKMNIMTEKMKLTPPKKSDPLSYEVLRQANDSSSCAISIADATDSNLPLIYVNRTFEEITGYSKEEVLGKNCRFLQGSHRNQKGVQEIRKALKSKKSCVVRLQNYKKDGSLFWNELRLAPVFNDSKKLTHFIGVQTDITEQVEAEEKVKKNQEELELLVDERTFKLKQKNLALQEILSQIELEKKKIKDQVIENVDSILLPLLHSLRERLDEKDVKYADLIQQNLEELTSTFGLVISRKLYKLTPREIEICNMIRSGLSTKEIAKFFHVSDSTIENQRNAIRKKLGISKQEVNLTTYLQSLSGDSA